jgi:hypothetical protein
MDSLVTISDINIRKELRRHRDHRVVARHCSLSDGSLSVIETTRGAVDLTTIFATESSPGRLKAVRAQHAYVFLTVPPFDENPTVVQSYGDCEPVSGH